MLNRENPGARDRPGTCAQGFPLADRIASITARAIGASGAPPVRLWRSSATAIATSGRAFGLPAKAMNHVVLRPATPVSAVPVLTARRYPGAWAAVSGPPRA